MDAEGQAINAPVQSFIGDYKVMCLIEIHKKLDRTKLRIVGEHHDAILMVVREGCEDECMPEVLDIMESPELLETFNVELSIPMAAEAEIGNWGQGKSYAHA